MLIYNAVSLILTQTRLYNKVYLSFYRANNLKCYHLFFPQDPKIWHCGLLINFTWESVELSKYFLITANHMVTVADEIMTEPIPVGRKVTELLHFLDPEKQK